LEVRLARVEGQATAPDGADEAIASVDLERAWHQLSGDEQDTLALTVFERLDAARAGEVLGISATAYRMRLSRARTSLRTALAGPVVPAPAATREPSQEI